jgi:hypothetical protein
MAKRKAKPTFTKLGWAVVVSNGTWEVIPDKAGARDMAKFFCGMRLPTRVIRVRVTEVRRG